MLRRHYPESHITKYTTYTKVKGLCRRKTSPNAPFQLSRYKRDSQVSNFGKCRTAKFCQNISRARFFLVGAPKGRKIRNLYVILVNSVQPKEILVKNHRAV